NANGKMCDICGKRPAVYCILNGVMGEIYCCQQCLYEKQNVGVKGFVDFLSEDVVCPVCGTTLSEFENSSYVGCSDCYRIFRQEVLSKIQDMHNTRKHMGKRLVKRSDNKNINLTDREKLKEQYFLAKEENRTKDAEEFYKSLNKERDDE
ncbi:MAG: hypothetical protein RSB08_00745, partial [Clostridia bacterium]